MQEYKELMMIKNNPAWPSNQKEIMVDSVIVNYAKNHSRKETLLYNNRIFFGYIRPSEQRKKEYDVNRIWILNNFKNTQI